MFKVTQWFGEHPENYEQFGLPGHEGIDIVAPHGQDVFAVLSGSAYRVETNPNVSNYGIHVRLQHIDGFKTIYAHFDRATITQGQQVNGGQKVGEADNTGNSFGDHLHLGEKEDGVTYIDEDGIQWPFNFRDPWLHLEPIYREWLDNNGTIGWLYSPGLIVNKQGNYARVFGTLNFRESPAASGVLLGQVTTHTVVALTGFSSNGYLQVLSPIDIPATTPPPPSGNTKFGLHFRADPDANVSGAEYNEQTILLQAGGGTAKLLHNHPATVYHRVCQLSPKPETIVIRAFVSFGGRVVTAQNFYDWTWAELADRISIVQSYGIEPIVELHNEPNLIEEGLVTSWADGTQFAVWLTQLLIMYRANSTFSGVKFIYPGLSPGGTIANVRQDSTTFLNQSIQTGILYEVDGVACHAYWSQNWPMQTAIDHVNYVKQTSGKPVWVTECSRNDRPSIVTPQVYGQEYALFRNSISAEGIYYFVGSASNLYFEPEVWVRENGSPKGIASALRNAL